jgi:hypothetical protein
LLLETSAPANGSPPTLATLPRAKPTGVLGRKKT